VSKPLALSAVLAACLAFGPAAAFAAGITGTKHDFSGKGWGTTDLCIFCHTPHKAVQSTFGPVWNHAPSSTVYQLYGGGVTGKGTVVNQPGPASAACLSCHDGTVAVDAFGGAAGNPATRITGDALIGTDLRDDHPIGVVHTVASGYKAPTNAKLFNTRVECASCHDVHNNTFSPFLRMSNSGSALCLDCHTK